MSNLVYLSFGSNQTPKSEYLNGGIGRLNLLGQVKRISPWYTSLSYGFKGDDFINFVVEYETKLSLMAVQTEIKQIEADFGRVKGNEKFSNRTLDIDILLFNEEFGDFGEVTLPRSEITEVSYVLKPLVDLIPDLRLPNQNHTLAELWQAFSGDMSGLKMR